MRVAFVVAIVMAGVGVNAEDGYTNPYAIDYTSSLTIQPLNLNPYSSLSNSTNLPNSPFTTSTVEPYVSPYSNAISSYSLTNPATVISPSGDYLGNTSSNTYDANSINNPYGVYGSKYSPDSVNNPYGKFGSKYSPTSANNEYAVDTPQLYGESAGEYRGKLSANKYDASSVENPYSAKYDEPLAMSRQQLRQQIVTAYSKNPDDFLKAYSLLSTSKQNYVLDLLKEE
jgi:hypothetical protein